MTVAICFKCGRFKFGALTPCKNCRVSPSTEKERILSVAMTDHFFDEAALKNMGDDIARGLTPEFPDAFTKQLSEIFRKRETKKRGEKNPASDLPAAKREAPKFDAVDIAIHSKLDQWVAIEWKDGLFPPPKDVAYGTHLASFIFCEPGAEIRCLNFAWLVKHGDGEFFKSCEAGVGIEAVWFFKYSTLSKFPIQELAPIDVARLDLPALGSDLDLGVSDRLRAFRGRDDLNRFRHPGFPDDFFVEMFSDSASYGCEHGIAELIWVRLKEVIGKYEFRAELINQPRMFAGKKGNIVTVELTGSEGDLVLRVKDAEVRRGAEKSDSVARIVLEDRFLERAKEAVSTYRFIFEAMQRRFEVAYPRLVLSKFWNAFVGIGTVAGCFTIALQMVHEVPEKMSTPIETVMRDTLDLKWPGSRVFYEELAELVSDVLLETPREDRGRTVFQLAARWVIHHVTGEEGIEGYEQPFSELVAIFVQEAPGFWKSVEGYGVN